MVKKLFKIIPLLLPSRWMRRLSKTQRNYVHMAVGAVLVLLIPMAIATFRTPPQAEAAWMDDSFSYRQRVDITNSGSAVTDYQVAITLDTATLITAGKMQSDCDDIRVTDVNGKLQPYWIEKLAASDCNDDTTKIWTKSTSIPTPGITLYIYYGNPSASSTENGKQTFVHFDDFTNGFDTSMWTEADPSSMVSISSNRLAFLTGNGAWNTSVYLTSAIARGDMAMEYDYQWTSANASYDAFMGGWKDDGAGASYANLVYGYYNISSDTCTSACPDPIYEDGVNTTANGSGSWTQNTNYKVQVRMRNSGGAYFNQSTDGGINFTNSYTSVLSTESNLHPGWTHHTGDHYLDNFFVRKDAATPPTIASPTNEEKGTAPIAYWKFDDGTGAIANNSQWKSNGTVTNLLQNPSAETNTGGWIAASNVTVARDTTQYLFGTSSIKSTSVAAGNSSTYTVNADNSDVAVSPSTTYTYSVWCKKGTGDGNCYIYIRWFTSGSVYISDSSAAAIAPNTTSWQKVSVTVTSPVNAAKAQPVILIQAAGAGGEYTYYDGAQLEISSTATNYCDGSITGNGTHSWTGTAHASTSTCSNGTDGMISGATWQSEDQSISGKSLLFDGTNDSITTYPGTSSPLNLVGDFTVGYWIRTTSTSASVVSFMDQASGTGGFGVNIGQGGVAAGKISAWTTAAWVGGNTAINDNKWHYISVTSSSTALTIYVDGVSDGSGTSAGATTWSGARKIGVAATSDTEYLKGSLDEVKLYNFALTAAQIKANYAAKASGDGASAVLGSNPNSGSTLSNGLVGYWKMDETATPAVDSSGNSNSGTWTGNATNATGKFGNAISLDGTGDYVQAADSTSLDVTQFTLAVWMNPTTLGGRLIDKQTAGGADGYTFDTGGNLLRFCGTSCVSSSTTPTTSVWSHAIVTFDGTTLRFYLNGAADGTSTAISSVATNALPLRLGADSAGTSGFTGKLDEARVYNRALSPNEVSTLYNFAPGPVGYWSMEEGSGTSTVDKSGNANTGTLTNGPTWTSGKYGKAVNFDGTDDYIDSAAATGHINTQVTFSAWANLTANPSGFSQIIGASGATGAIYVNSSGQAFFQLSLTTAGNVGTTATAMSSGWHHYSATWSSGDKLKYYVDGVLISSSTLAYTDTIGSITAFRLARYSSGTYLNAKIDEAKIYNYARTAKQIVEDMNAGHPAVGSPVGSAIGHWKFDEGSDNTCSGGTNDACNSGSQGSALDGAQTGMAVPATSTSGWSQNGKFGKAIAFDGSDDRIAISDNAAFDLNSYTLSAWVKTSDAGAGRRRIISQQAAGYWVLSFENNFLGGCDSLAGSCYQSTATLNDNVWHHIAMVRTSGTDIRWYKDGVLVLTQAASSTSAHANADSVFIGRYTGATEYYLGLIDEVKVYNYNLTAAEVKIDMNRGSSQVMGALSDNSSYQIQAANQEYCVPGDSTSCAAPVGSWDFEEGTGTTAYDKAGNGETGTLTNSPTWTNGKTGKAIKFTGGTEYVSVANSANNNLTGDATYQAWIKPQASNYPNGATNYHFFHNEVFQTKGMTIRLDGTTGKPYYRSNQAAAYTDTMSDTGLTANVWSHVAVVKSGTNVKFYINGRLTGYNSGSGTVGHPVTTTDVMALGGYTTSQGLEGSMDGARIFNYARSAAQVAWDYNKGLPIAHWKFDECQGTTINDSSTNGNGTSNGLTGTIAIGGTGTYTLPGTCSSGTVSHAWAGGVAGAGKRNYALSFDGTDDVVTTADSDLLDVTQAITLAVWYKEDVGAGTNRWLIDKGPVNTSWAMFLENGLKFRLNGASDCIVTEPSEGVWHYAVSTYDRTSVKVYVDGVLQGTCAQTAAMAATATGVRIGAHSGPGYWFKGQMDDVRVYNYALTAAQIKALYTGGTINYAPLTGAP